MWRQPFNRNKTIYIRFTNSKRYKNFEKNWKNLGTKLKPIFFGEIIPRSQTHEVLGILLQHDLKFEQHYKN